MYSRRKTKTESVVATATPLDSIHLYPPIFNSAGTEGLNTDAR